MLHLQTSFKNCSQLFLLFSALIVAAPGFAQDGERERHRVNQILSQAVYKIVSQAREAMDQNNHNEARTMLDNLLATRDNLSDFEKASAHQLLSYVHVNREDYPAAVSASESAIALAALDHYTELELRYNLVQLYSVLEQYDKSLQHLNIWFQQAENPGARAYFSAAQIYAVTEQFERALDYALQGMNKHKAADSEPRESWYRLLLAIHLQQKNFRAAIPLLEEMVGYWPTQVQYYQQLSGLYQEFERHRDALAALSLAYQNTLLENGNDIKRLADLYRFNDYPYKGAVILQAALDNRLVPNEADNWQTLANAWLQAREWQRGDRALRQAAQLAPTGETWLLLCQTAFQDERWPDAEGYCEQALDKGGLDNTADAWQLLARSRHQQDDVPGALAAFKECARLEAGEETCRRWREYLENNE